MQGNSPCIIDMYKPQRTYANTCIYTYRIYLCTILYRVIALTDRTKLSNNFNFKNKCLTSENYINVAEINIEGCMLIKKMFKVIFVFSFP